MSGIKSTSTLEDDGHRPVLLTLDQLRSQVAHLRSRDEGATNHLDQLRSEKEFEEDTLKDAGDVCDECTRRDTIREGLLLGASALRYTLSTMVRQSPPLPHFFLGDNSNDVLCYHLRTQPLQAWKEIVTYIRWIRCLYSN